MKHLRAYKIFEGKSSDDESKENTIILFHGSPYKFDEFKSQDELEYNHSGHALSGISFTDEKQRANRFADTLPSIYYDDLKSIRNSFNDIDEILKKVEYISRLNKYGSVDKLENDIKKVKISLLDDWERFKDMYSWLDENKQWAEFEKRNEYSLKELETLKSSLKSAKHLSQYSISDSEQLELDNYNKKLNELDKRYNSDYGFVYTCEITYNEIYIENGENIGFGSHRGEVVDNLEKDSILKINDADTGHYIGVEFIVPDEGINNIKILKREKSK